jgi:hypothetical protein
MKREDLRPYLERELSEWSAKPYGTLREELRQGYNAERTAEFEYHVEVDLVENRDDYVHVNVAVCSPAAPWSCYHPLSKSFLVYRDGRVDKP